MYVVLHSSTSNETIHLCCSVSSVHGHLCWSCAMWFKISSFDNFFNNIYIYRNNNINDSYGEGSLQCANLTKQRLLLQSGTTYAVVYVLKIRLEETPQIITSHSVPSQALHSSFVKPYIQILFLLCYWKPVPGPHPADSQKSKQLTPSQFIPPCFCVTAACWLKSSEHYAIRRSAQRETLDQQISVLQEPSVVGRDGRNCRALVYL